MGDCWVLTITIKEVGDVQSNTSLGSTCDVGIILWSIFVVIQGLIV